MLGAVWLHLPVVAGDGGWEAAGFMSISYDQAVMADNPPVPTTLRAPRDRRFLVGPVTDFLCLGGITLLLFPIAFVLPEKEYAPVFLVGFLWAANLINHPHFAFSYQVFYENFRHKAFGPDNKRMLRARYVFAGIVVPVLLAAFLAYGVIGGNALLLGRSANLMGFLVGWHYVKQGYGMLMVDAALKRQFFDATEKKILLINSYALWLLTWLGGNWAFSQRKLWGIEYYMFHVPPALLTAAIGVAASTTIVMLIVLAVRWRANGGSLPVNGVVAYLVSLYAWMLLARYNALWLVMVPALHSLQYLLVALRYRLNRFQDETEAVELPRRSLLARVLPHRHQRRYAGFIVLGVILGATGFWGAPTFLQITVPYNQAALGATVFLFLFWIFINVHHYFLDNVMWRSENADVRKYLFS